MNEKIRCFVFVEHFYFCRTFKAEAEEQETAAAVCSDAAAAASAVCFFNVFFFSFKTFRTA